MFEEALAAYVAGANKLLKDHYVRMKFSGPSFDNDRIEATAGGVKYVRVIMVGTSQRAAYSFVERATGDVFKPESWKKPAKHARGNIYSAGNGLETHTYFGPAYLRC